MERLGAVTAGKAAGANARVAILLSTYNGERFLPEQLASLTAQTHADWSLHWRDDGSFDRSVAMVRDFAATIGPPRARAQPSIERAREHPSQGRLGATGSFLFLLRAARSDDAAFYAFADQDDVWLTDKLARAVAALAPIPAGTPALYCARQILVDETLTRIGLSPAVAHKPGFPSALIQNIAAGCTIVLNRAAAEIVLSGMPPASAYHDWWCYLVVAAAGGEVVHDPEPAILYRQHASNVVGARATLIARGIAALFRGPRRYMDLIRDNIAALTQQPHLLSAGHARILSDIARARNGSLWQRLSVLRDPGLRRQTPVETLWFRYAFMFF